MYEKNPQRMGPVGHCICPKCGFRISHKRGVPCQDQKCPQCGVKLMREGSYHHNLLLAKKKKKKENS